uniref:Uncharacterized protein n=1 Tax=Oryza barthii TaxID=65489 RepID=A0A0D3GEH1_9ORYZ
MHSLSVRRSAYQTKGGGSCWIAEETRAAVGCGACPMAPCRRLAPWRRWSGEGGEDGAAISLAGSTRKRRRWPQAPQEGGVGADEPHEEAMKIWGFWDDGCADWLGAMTEGIGVMRL